MSYKTGNIENTYMNFSFVSDRQQNSGEIEEKRAKVPGTYRSSLELMKVPRNWNFWGKYKFQFQFQFLILKKGTEVPFSEK